MIATKKCRVESGEPKLSTVTKYGDTKIEGYYHKCRPLIKFSSGSFYLPKDNKDRPQGEDAHFLCREKNTIGVADGVGGWARLGVDSGKYARHLMANCVFALQDEPKGGVNPARILKKAYSKTHDQGSSTACIAALNGRFLDYVNLGDSGLMVFRDKKLVYQSQVQQHKFNHPYQLGSKSSVTPSMAYKDRINVEAGDIVVLGTDGLLDNMYPSEIMEVLEQHHQKEPEELAWAVAESALLNALDDDEDYISPFARAAQKVGRYHPGGKYDDITVIVAKIEAL